MLLKEENALCFVVDLVLLQHASTKKEAELQQEELKFSVTNVIVTLCN